MYWGVSEWCREQKGERSNLERRVLRADRRPDRVTAPRNTRLGSVHARSRFNRVGGASWETGGLFGSRWKRFGSLDWLLRTDCCGLAGRSDDDSVVAGQSVFHEERKKLLHLCKRDNNKMYPLSTENIERGSLEAPENHHQIAIYRKE